MADLNQIAHRTVQKHTQPKHPETEAQVSGRKGGLRGGKVRAERLTAKERSEIAQKAARARWSAKHE